MTTSAASVQSPGGLGDGAWSNDWRKAICRFLSASSSSRSAFFGMNILAQILDIPEISSEVDKAEISCPISESLVNSGQDSEKMGHRSKRLAFAIRLRSLGR